MSNERYPVSPSSAPAVGSSTPLLVVLSAPSGAGKTTVCQQLLASRPGLVRVVTCTTRAPRDNERDGVDYHFLTPEDFLRRLQAGNFLEHASVFGNSYGTLKSDVLETLRANQDVLLIIDVQGAAAVRIQALNDDELRRALVTVFLTTPSLAVLEERLRRRGTETPTAMQKRLSVARQEIAQTKNFDYVIVSGTIADDVARMKAILDAERMKQGRVALPNFG